MKDLKEHMQSELNESANKSTEIANYVKGWLMEASDKRSAWDIIMGIEAGVNMAIMERNHLKQDTKYDAGTKVFEKLSRAIGDLQD